MAHPTLWLAVNHHRTHKGLNIDFTGYPYLKAIYLDESPIVDIIKSTQSGLSEYLTVRDIGRAMKGRSVFHVLPTGQLRNRYVKNRFDKSVQNTPFYYQLIQGEDERRTYGRGSESVSLKQVGPGTIAYVSSNSEASFTEFPADDLVIDELDQCNQEVIPMGEERLSNSDNPSRVRISNPTVEGYGIDDHYAKSDKKKWFVKCPHCGHWFHPEWYEHVVQQEGEENYVLRDTEWDYDSPRDIAMVCDKCAGLVHKGAPGDWVRETQFNGRSGYQISKLFTAKTTLREMAERFEEGLVKTVVMQRFYNADLGLAFTAEGAKITDANIDGALGDWRNGAKLPGYPIAGIDVGSVCNYVIGYVTPSGEILAGEIGILRTTAEDIYAKLKEKGVNLCVIDARPEASLVRKLKEMHRGTYSAYYAEDAIRESVDQFRNVKIDRTTTLDSVKEGLVSGRFKLPVNAKSIPEFYAQMTAATRIFDPEAHKGQGSYKWTEGSKADHYHHAFNYLGVAKRLIVLMSR